MGFPQRFESVMKAVMKAEGQMGSMTGKSLVACSAILGTHLGGEEVSALRLWGSTGFLTDLVRCPDWVRALWAILLGTTLLPQLSGNDWSWDCLVVLPG